MSKKDAKVDIKKIKCSFGLCICLVVVMGAYLFFVELDKGQSYDAQDNTVVVEK